MRYYWEDRELGTAEVGAAPKHCRFLFRTHESVGIFSGTDWIVRMLRFSETGRLRAGSFGPVVDLGEFLQGIANHQRCATNTYLARIAIHVDPAGLESSSERLDCEDSSHDIC